MEVTITRAGPADAGELLTLQRAAYVTEAQIYGDPRLPPLVQTLDDLRCELAASVALKAVHDHRIVGSVRGRLEGRTLHIGRLVVAPDLQGQGIGSRLVDAIEREAPVVDRYELFTGHRSEGNLRLYARVGYQEVRREVLNDLVTLVFMQKPAPSAQTEATTPPGSGAAPTIAAGPEPIVG